MGSTAPDPGQMIYDEMRNAGIHETVASQTAKDLGPVVGDIVNNGVGNNQIVNMNITLYQDPRVTGLGAHPFSQQDQRSPDQPPLQHPEPQPAKQPPLPPHHWQSRKPPARIVTQHQFKDRCQGDTRRRPTRHGH
jgi:hypothetical protein